MARRGSPTFQVVREGNPGHRPLREGVVLPPDSLVEPNWADRLPGDSAEAVQLRADVSALWARIANTLERSMGLVAAQQAVFEDYCISWARIQQGERALTAEGAVIPSPRPDRGTVRNPWTTVLNQYRPHFRALAGELGLTPSAVGRIIRTDPGADDDPFD